MQEEVVSASMDLWGAIAKLWSFQLFLVEGSPITVGKVLIGIVFLIGAYFVAGILSRAVGRRLLQRLSMQNSLKYTLERLVFYLFFVVLTLFVLQMLSIPITIFSLIGGALALGLGFGSQNVVNNFISGLIVMVEQPLRVGDFIEIDGVFGVVEVIGSRSTALRTLDNKQTIVPNSFFLEKMFVNWTLANHEVGSKVSVGVAYSSDIAHVRELLLRVAAEHADVLKTPSPFVRFDDFAESSLNFSLHFSIHFSEQLTVNQVASDLRYRIAQVFREKNIEIPFPQREVVVKSGSALAGV